MALSDTIQNFVHGMHDLHQRRKRQQALEKQWRESVESELEIRLMEVSDLMGLPPSHPMVVAGVVYATRLENERRRAKADQLTASFIGQGWND